MPSLEDFLNNSETMAPSTEQPGGSIVSIETLQEEILSVLNEHLSGPCREGCRCDNECSVHTEVREVFDRYARL